MSQVGKQRTADVMRVYKTAVFKIHKPSRRKRALLDDALRRNHLAYTKALRILTVNIEAYAAQEKRERDASMQRAAAKIVTALPLSSAAKAGVIADVMGQINSYIELRGKQETASPPTARRLSDAPSDYVEALQNFAGATNLKEENAARARLMSEAHGGEPRPLLFLRNRKDGGYLVLNHPETGKYAVYMNLHSEKSRFASEVRIGGWADVRTGEVMEFVSRTGCAFPVEFGAKFQLEQFLRKGVPQSAKLVKAGNDYEIHVSFLFETPKVEVTTVLGVRRGIYNLASLCVLDRDGRILDRENVEGRSLRASQIKEEQRQREGQKQARRYRSTVRLALADEAVHAAANRIVGRAAKYRSQVVLADLRSLTARGRKRSRSKFKHVLNRSQYAKLERVLEYKLALAGLPKPKGVGAEGTSRTCPRCGNWHSGNIPKTPEKGALEMSRFLCITCGYEDDADLNAARVIGQKKTWREQLPLEWRTKRAVEIPQEFSFKRFLADCAERRGNGPDTFRGRDLDEGRTTPPE
jgi:IS605 OrfB family transposase